MYYLPILINNRRTHMCKFSTVGWQRKKFGPNDKLPLKTPHFVIDYSKEGASTTVLKIEHDSKFLAHNGTKGDNPLKGDWIIGPSSTDPSAVIIELKQNQNGKPLNESEISRISAMTGSPLNVFSIESEGDNLLLKYTPPDLNKLKQRAEILGQDPATISKSGIFEYKVIFRLQLYQKELNLEHDANTETQFEYQFHIHMGPSRNLYQMVLDFGSESSQMGYVSPNNSSEFIHVPFIKILRDEFRKYKKRQPKDSDFFQFDMGSKSESNRLLRSLFFALRADGELKVSQPPFKFKREDKKDLLQILKLQIELIEEIEADEKSLIIPNAKLMDTIDDSIFSINIHGKTYYYKDIKEILFRMILNHFFHVFLSRVSAANLDSLSEFDYLADSEADQSENILRITLLVPNIYSQKKVIQLMKTFRSDTDHIARQYKNRYNLNFSGIEVQILSESDASFYGMLSSDMQESNPQININPAEKLVIFDAGKGTIDISILRKIHDQEYNSVFRSGVIGSGGAITYAFMETLAAIIVGTNDSSRKDFIHAILKLNPLYQTKIMSSIDRLKFNFRPNNKIELEDLQNNAAYKEGIGEIKKSVSAMDITGFYDNLNVWLERIIDQNLTIDDYYGIIQNTIDALSDKVIQELSSYTQAFEKNEDQEMFQTFVFAGRAFRFKPFVDTLGIKLKNIFPSAGFSWKSNKAKTACLQAPIDMPQSLKSADLIGEPILLKKGAMKNSELNWLDRKIGNFFQTSKKEQTIGIDQFIKHGLTYNGADQKIAIGKFKPAASNLNNGKNQEFNIIFTGEEFLRRSTSESESVSTQTKIAGEQSPEENNLVWRSIFPNIYNEDESDLKQAIRVSPIG